MQTTTTHSVIQKHGCRNSTNYILKLVNEPCRNPADPGDMVGSAQEVQWPLRGMYAACGQGISQSTDTCQKS